MTFGNYDAGKFRPISNPLFNGGVRKAESGKTEFNFDFGFNKADKVGDLNNSLGITKTMPTMEERIAEAILPKDGFFATLAERAEYDRDVDNFFGDFTNRMMANLEQRRMTDPNYSVPKDNQMTKEKHDSPLYQNSVAFQFMNAPLDVMESLA